MGRLKEALIKRIFWMFLLYIVRVKWLRNKNVLRRGCKSLQWFLKADWEYSKFLEL